jgi:hypothetical protein
MHVSDDDLERYLFGQLRSRQLSAVESHLAECSFCASRLSDVTLLTNQLSKLSDRKIEDYGGIEKRDEHRIPCDDPGEMQRFSPFSIEKTLVQITNFSRNGLKVHTPQFVGRGTIVQVCSKRAIILGEVRFCVAAGAEFDAGIKLQDMIPRRSAY